MGVIESSGELLLTIVDDILDFSKLAAGKLVIENTNFDLAGVVEGVIDSFGALVRSKALGSPCSSIRAYQPACAEIPNACGKFSTTCCPTPSSSPRRARSC